MQDTWPGERYAGDYQTLDVADSNPAEKARSDRDQKDNLNGAGPNKDQRPGKVHQSEGSKAQKFSPRSSQENLSPRFSQECVGSVSKHEVLSPISLQKNITTDDIPQRYQSEENSTKSQQETPSPRSLQEVCYPDKTVQRSYSESNSPRPRSQVDVLSGMNSPRLEEDVLGSRSLQEVSHPDQEFQRSEPETNSSRPRSPQNDESENRHEKEEKIMETNLTDNIMSETIVTEKTSNCNEFPTVEIHQKSNPQDENLSSSDYARVQMNDNVLDHVSEVSLDVCSDDSEFKNKNNEHCGDINDASHMHQTQGKGKSFNEASLEEPQYQLFEEMQENKEIDNVGSAEDETDNIKQNLDSDRKETNENIWKRCGDKVNMGKLTKMGQDEIDESYLNENNEKTYPCTDNHEQIIIDTKERKYWKDE